MSLNFPSSWSRPVRPRGMTIPELLVVLVIIGILVGLSYSGYSHQIQKAESVDAQTKLKNMYHSLNAYIVDKQTWPQEPEDENMTDEVLWDWWKAEMKPFGVEDHEWYTTSHLRRLNRQFKESGGKSVKMSDMGKEEELKYPSIIPTNFPEGPTEPFRYRSQPWVTETGEYHGMDGIFAVMPDGRIHKLPTLSLHASARKKGD